ncbi:MAG TPA: cytochrome c oxidase subunit II [Gemmatimonadales bacterium]|nr:cytochrome c oxidase subunit II [Gemmatimonadales bacterium]
MPLAARAVRRLSRLAPLLVLLLVLVATACSRDFPQTTLAPKGDLARIEDDIFYTTVKWATLVFVLVEGALIYAIFRFRGKPGDPEPAQIHGNTVVEIAWTVIPALILAMIAVPTVKAIFKENETPKGRDVLTVEVIGHQWWWEFRYPELKLTTANELHVPVGRTVSLKMGAYDVVHSFWLPQFAGKRDVFPNRETRLWFTAEEPGEYTGQCAEFCGIQHGRMAFRVIAQEAAAFDAWAGHMQTLGAPAAAAATSADSIRTASAGGTVQQQAGKPGAPAPAAADSAKPAAPPEDPLVAQGQKLFLLKGCVGCHSLVAYNAPTGMLGPNLANVGARTYIAAGTLPNTDENLTHWIRVPQEVKHGVLMPNLGVNEDEAKALVAFLRTHR